MSNIDIRQLKDPSSGEVFYPQTCIEAVVDENGDALGIDASPTDDSDKLVRSGGVKAAIDNEAAARAEAVSGEASLRAEAVSNEASAREAADASLNIGVQAALAAVSAEQQRAVQVENTKYSKPAGGIPKVDLASDVRNALDLATDVVYDISAHNNNTAYADLAAALGNGGANVPQSLRKGGMSVRFVLSSDNKYVEFMYKLEYENTTAGNQDFINEYNWEKMNLEEEVSQLELKVTGLIDISGLEAKTMYPNDATWLVNTNYKCKFYLCTPGITYTITANNSYYGHATFVKEIGTASGQTVNYATGYSSMVTIVTGSAKSFLAPNDAVYLVIEVLAGGTDRTPASIVQPAVETTLTDISNRVISLNDSVNSLLIEQKPSSERGLYIDSSGTYKPFSPMRISECLNIPTIDCTIKHLWQDMPNVGYGIVFLDENYNFVGNLDVGNGIDVTYSWMVNNVPVPSGAKFIVLQSQNKEAVVYSSEILLTAINSQAMIRNQEALIHKNILFGKKWVACGDSWTAGDFTGYIDAQGHTGTESDAYDSEMGMYKTYPWWIAKRNGIILVNEAVAGTTMTTRVANSFSDVRYANVPLDADYITLMFGLNETTQSPGTSGSTDKSTLWGAWNFSLEYLMTNIPRAKIGVIIPDGWMAGDSAQTCRETMIEAATAWGIPYLDLTGDPHISLGVGGRISSLNLKTSAKILRDSQYKLENNHPNLLAHEMRSTYIEAWLRGL